MAVVARNRHLPKIEANNAKIRAMRQEASRMASMANKRIERIEKNELIDSPAYQRYVKDGGQRFGVRGKTNEEVKKEIVRLERFLKSETSTIRGINRELKVIAENTGIEYKDMKDLQRRAKKFFELSSKVMEHLRAMDETAAALDYRKIWEAVNEYTQTEKMDLLDADRKIDAMIRAVSEITLAKRKNEGYNPTDIEWFW